MYTINRLLEVSGDRFTVSGGNVCKTDNSVVDAIVNEVEIY